MVLFGQIVIGPPGAGKTTFCHGMKMYMEAIGRSCAIINLDFANDILPYIPAVDVRELMALEDVMEEHDLGPNGSLVYCMECLLANHEWLIARIEEVTGTGTGTGIEGGTDESDNKINYLIFDCPGQVELYTHYTCVQDLIHIHLEKKLDIRLCCVHLIDSMHCCSSTTFLSAVLLVAMTMLRLALPHISVLSKVDLLSKQYKDSCPFNIDFYTECLDLMPLTRFVDRPFNANYDEQQQRDNNSAKSTGNGGNSINNNDDSDSDEYNDGDGNDETGQKQSTVTAVPPSLLTGTQRFEARHRQMTAGLCELLTDYGMVSFSPCSIEDAETVGKVLESIDRCNGYSMTVSQAEYMVTNRMQAQAADANPNPNPVTPGAVHHVDSEPLFMKTLHVMERFAREEENESNSNSNNSSSDGASGTFHASVPPLADDLDLNEILEHV